MLRSQTARDKRNRQASGVKLDRAMAGLMPLSGSRFGDSNLMDLIIQPDAGASPLLSAVRRARRAIDIVIFRFDLDALEEELEAAVARGVVVRALIAHTNRGGAQRLRKLEQRLLKSGVTVCRTKDNLVRYHGKLLAADRRRVYILGFNYTVADLKSRSFGLVVAAPRIVKEVRRLFDSDANRTDFVPRVRDLVVSPENARRRLERFLRRARASVDIYDPSVTDDRMLALLERKAARGVRVRILGRSKRNGPRPASRRASFPASGCTFAPSSAMAAARSSAARACGSWNWTNAVKSVSSFGIGPSSRNCGRSSNATGGRRRRRSRRSRRRRA